MENAHATPVHEVDSKRALEAAYRHYESRLFRAALRITHSEDDAWDAVQDGMVNALRRAEHFRGDSAVASWLYSIVVSAALYHGRRDRATREHARVFCERVWPDADRSLAAGTRHRDPEAYVHARIDLARAEALLAALPEERRLLVEYAEGSASAELAAERRARRGARPARRRGEEPPVPRARGPAREVRRVRVSPVVDRRASSAENAASAP